MHQPEKPVTTQSKKKPQTAALGRQALSTFYGCRLLILDGSVPGSGQLAHYPECPPRLQKVPVLVAGGINSKNALECVERARKLGWNVIGVDSASGIALPSGVGFDKDLICDLSKTLKLAQGTSQNRAPALNKGSSAK